jgi:hypothetical protein
MATVVATGNADMERAANHPLGPNPTEAGFADRIGDASSRQPRRPGTSPLKAAVPFRAPTA